MPADPPPGGRLIGVGRTADVYAIDGARVLRRYRVPIDVQPEAEIMSYLAKAGFPVPAVYDADGQDMVMERLEGPDMLADLSSKPWLARRHARTLAALHDRLHAIEAPAALLIMASSEVDQVPAMLRLALRPVRAALIGGFLSAAGDDPRPYIAAVARERMRDRNVRPSEVERLVRMAAAAEQAEGPA
jgi:hypothetical protein